MSNLRPSPTTPTSRGIRGPHDGTGLHEETIEAQSTEFDQKTIVVTRSLYKVRVDKIALSQAQIYRAGPWGQGGAIVE